jgi:Mrp family chromosome partitioning ATPase
LASVFSSLPHATAGPFRSTGRHPASRSGIGFKGISISKSTLMINLCIVSTKGSVGKTTLTANLGGYLADHCHRVLRS